MRADQDSHQWAVELDRTDPFFIVGCGRSGSTLLRSMLVRHSRVQIPGETHFVPILLRTSVLLEKLPMRSRQQAMTNLLLANGRLKLSGLSVGDIQKGVESSRSGTVADAIRTVYEGYWRLQEGTNFDTKWSVVGDKTPSYVEHIPLIARFFNNSRFIHIVRDGREVASSVVKMPWGPSSYQGGLAQWERMVNAGREAEMRFPGRMIQVKYEDLVQSPVATMKKTCDHIGIAFESEMLESGGVAEARSIAAQNFHPDTHANLGERLAAVHHKKNDRRLTHSQAQLLTDLGYNVGDFTPLPFLERLRAGADDRLSAVPVSRRRVYTAVNLLMRTVRKQR